MDLDPVVGLALGEVENRGEAVVARVLDGDGIVEIGGSDEAEHGTEALGASEPRSWAH